MNFETSTAVSNTHGAFTQSVQKYQQELFSLLCGNYFLLPLIYIASLPVDVRAARYFAAQLKVHNSEFGFACTNKNKTKTQKKPIT